MVFAACLGGMLVIIGVCFLLAYITIRSRLAYVAKKFGNVSHLNLLCRIMGQSLLSICLMSEYALSMTSSFQIRYFRKEGKTSTTFGAATTFLIVVCFGTIVLGVSILWGKSEEALESTEFKFTWGAFYKYYVYEHRYFFVAKIMSEIGSGIIIGAVSHVPTQLTLLMSVQMGMFLYTVQCRPFIQYEYGVRDEISHVRSSQLLFIR